MGRPKSLDPKSAQLNVRLDAETFEALRRLAAARGLTPSAFVRGLTTQRLKTVRSEPAFQEAAAARAAWTRQNDGGDVGGISPSLSLGSPELGPLEPVIDQ